MKNKERLIQETDSPVAATLAISFLEKSEDNIRRVARAKNRTYKSLTSASKDGLARRHLIPAIQNALMESNTRPVLRIQPPRITGFEKMV